MWIFPLRRILKEDESAKLRWVFATLLSPTLASTISDWRLSSISIYDAWVIGAGACPGCALTRVWGEAVPDMSETRLAFNISAALHCETCFRERKGIHLLDVEVESGERGRATPELVMSEGGDRLGLAYAPLSPIGVAGECEDITFDKMWPDELDCSAHSPSPPTCKKRR